MNKLPTSVTPKTVLQATQLQRTFHEGGLHVSVLQGVDIRVQAGQTLAIVGASGSGKSTLLHVLGGLDQANAGTIHWGEQDISQLSAAQLGRLRNQALGFVYQFHHLLPECNALENVAMPLAIRRVAKAEREARAAALLAKVGLTARMLHRPSALSGGERQRVALARALVGQPVCVLADEPTGNLDRSSASVVFDLLLQLAREEGTAIVMVTHDEQLARRCDQHWALHGGRLQAVPDA